MTSYFLDSSALVKRYLPEIGSDWIRAVASRSGDHTILIAHVTAVEVVSGVARRVREGGLSDRAAQAVRLLLDHHVFRDYQVIQLTDAVVAAAQDLLLRHPLRAYDAVQLASALRGADAVRAAGLTLPTFISADERLLSAASPEGLPTLNPTAAA